MNAASAQADFVIVGAGSAGCVLANRLSANGHARVLLLEAGGPGRNPWLHIPGGYFKTIHDPRYGWGYLTAPEPALDGREIPWPRGRVLGGSSAINGMIYIRGQREDFEHWRQLGNSGWGWDEVLPYFRRAQHQTRGTSELHGTGGPLTVSDCPDRHPLCEAFVQAAVSCGLPRNADFNGPTQDGAGYYQLTTRNGWRASTASAYLAPVRRRPNLSVVTGALVTRIEFNGRRAVGVAYRRAGREHRAIALREVILCGGAINSPQLLQCSGIGPPALLREHGVDVVSERVGVGENLQDHLQVQIVYRAAQPITVNDELRSPVGKAKLALRYLLRRAGPLGGGPSPVGAFATVSPQSATADVQLFLMPLSVARPGVLDVFSGYTLCVNQSRPESRGRIAITAADAREPPRIEPNYLASASDRRILIAGVRLARDIAAAPAFAPYRDLEERPGAQVCSTDEILAYIRARASTMYHPIGTCRMGADPEAVVDSTLRVRGVDALRVADASVMPTLVSGNTNAATIMIAEKAADLIMRDEPTPGDGDNAGGVAAQQC